MLNPLKVEGDTLILAGGIYIINSPFWIENPFGIGLLKIINTFLIPLEITGFIKDVIYFKWKKILR